MPLKQLATLSVVDRPSTINREWGRRLLKVQVNVRDRDIASFVDEARARISDEIVLPDGYLIEWGGQFENLECSRQRLMIVVPLTLLLIFILLYFSLKRFSDVLILYTGIPLAAIGGVIMLYGRGIPFSVSAAIGFIALSGTAAVLLPMFSFAASSIVVENIDRHHALTVVIDGSNHKQVRLYGIDIPDED
ncbi:efflux RND transporter permease subunit [uncultured Desulfuromonas sp.]|uniref:efflux RND transporter permease subunit n=1 Tax=uncultured Desulfuromonas sp. TaxID=181013 RepID=UPI00374D6AB4